MPPRASVEPSLGIPSSVTTFEQRRQQYEDITFSDLVKKLQAERAPDTKLSFNPEEALFYKEAKETLKLTNAEQALLKKNGFVEVDHGQPYTMGSMYYGIYTRDLPVLITTDSMLYAWHRSFDNMLAKLEASYLAPQLQTLLTEAHARLKAAYPKASGAARDSLRQSEVYLVVALNLLQGEGLAPIPQVRRYRHSVTLAFSPANLQHTGFIRTSTGQDAQVRAILKMVRHKVFQGIGMGKTWLFGAPRRIDYTQLAPRGHYTKNQTLKRYFQTMMWLGRDDTGVTLTAPREGAALDKEQREAFRNALTLSALLGSAESKAKLASFRTLIDGLIGPGSNLIPEEVQGVSNQLPVTDEVLEKSLPALRKLGGQAQVRSKIMYVSPNPQAEEQPLSTTFQMFGQRFTVDAFALSKMVHDSVRYQGKKVERWMPEGRDAMAVLGNDEAVFQLEKGLKKQHYGGSLLAARQVVDGYSEGDWAQSTYNRWLSTLRTLDDAPEGPYAPEVMKGRPWQAKQLETQISSWANLRHDTILYTKQSYTSGALCEYPTGYVEPYPEFYRSLADMARPLAILLQETAGPLEEALKSLRALQKEKRKTKERLSDEQRAEKHRLLQNSLLLQSAAGLFGLFDSTSIELERLARKELAGLPFTDDERFFLKQTVDLRGGGSGPPTWDGWYTKLIYGEKPKDFNPTVSDVHTDTEHQQVLQVGVGAAKYLLVAIDNGEDKMIFVGPKYSYYEFHKPAASRMTDEEWEALLTTGGAPSRPAWTSAYRTDAKKRGLKGSSPQRDQRGRRIHPRTKDRKEYELRGRKGFGQLPTEH